MTSLPWDIEHRFPLDGEPERIATERAVRLEMPKGARILGCHNCLAGDRLQHSTPGMTYCAVCPVTHRRGRR
jgi:hypothetical protein